MQFLEKPPIQEIEDDQIREKQVRLFLLREDLNHPTIQGNKWRKLKLNILQAQEESRDTLLTFGGAFSNHIHATAAAGKTYGFHTVGVIRGERVEPLNPTLASAEANGMQLHFISREAYRKKDEPDFIHSLEQEFGNFYHLPEGGTNKLAILGCEEIKSDIPREYESDYCCVPVGTGGTMTGLIRGFGERTKVLGFSSLKGNFLTAEIESLLSAFTDKDCHNWEIMTDYHFGGYARFKPELIHFINDFNAKFGIRLDPIYTGKMLYGIFDLISKDYFPKGSRVLAIHTGGLQGIDGFNQRHGDILLV